MTTVELIGIILGSGVIGAIINNIFKAITNRKKTAAGTLKLKNEAGQIVLEGELKVTEFYKEQLEALLTKYSGLEIKLEEKIKEHRSCEEKIAALEVKYNDLQRQFTLLKTQLAALTNV